MAAHLEKTTGARCRCWPEIGQLTAVGDGTEIEGVAAEMCLVDCLGLDLDRFVVAGEDFGGHLHAGRVIALFNVAAGERIEERALTMGIRGVFYPDDPLDRFAKGIAAMLKGELWVSRSVMTDVILKENAHVRNGRPNSAVLTRRETEILELMAIGATNDDIAGKLCISPNTVKTHIYNIFKKIDVPNRLQAALWAAKHL
ncbi:MAG: hypothetical protein JEZ11_03000 [Desulfobacterales bacterium]|nr:hypothetical protein [Desulfobacterales bacterium]